VRGMTKEVRTGGAQGSLPNVRSRGRKSYDLPHATTREECWCNLYTPACGVARYILAHLAADSARAGKIVKNYKRHNLGADVDQQWLSLSEFHRIR
jgi:hypothetical protein